MQVSKLFLKRLCLFVFIPFSDSTTIGSTLAFEWKLKPSFWGCCGKEGRGDSFCLTPTTIQKQNYKLLHYNTTQTFCNYEKYIFFCFKKTIKNYKKKILLDLEKGAKRNKYPALSANLLILGPQINKDVRIIVSFGKYCLQINDY